MENETKKVVTTTKNGVIVPLKEIEAPIIYSAKALCSEELPETNYIVKPILAEGVTVLSAKPKIGKSWFAMQMCLAVATGSHFMGFPTQKGKAIYFDFENSKSIQKSRLEKMLNGKEPPEDFLFISENVPRMKEGFEEYLLQVLEQVEDVKLIVIDVFRHIQSKKKANENDYDFVYGDISVLKEFAGQMNIAIVLVTHNRKMTDITDPFSDVLGSTGFMGASDETMVIYKKERKDKDATISITGRSVPPNDFVMKFNKKRCLWEMEGELDDYEYKMERRAYESDPVIQTIKKSMEQNGGKWKGKVGELISSSKYYQTPIHLNVQQLGRKMSKYIKDLQMYDGIITDVTKHEGSLTYFIYPSSNPFEE